MYILSKTNYQDFENNVESFKTLEEAQDAMRAYYTEDKKTVEMLVGAEEETDDGVRLYISDYFATAHCEEFWMEYQIYDFSNPIVDSKTAKQISMGDKFLNRNEMEINDFLENQMVMFRGTKSEIAMKVAEFFGKQPDAVCETDEEDKDCDYHMSVSFSEQTSNGTKWCDIDLYYLKMRKKNHRYVTEVSFELC